MSPYTKTGLLLLMILIVLNLITAFLSYGFYSSFRPTAVHDSFLPGTVPITMIGLLGGLFTLIGGLLILIGKNEFGKHHSRFITYASVVFIVSQFIPLFSTLAFVEYPLVLFLVSSFISAILFGLMWILVLYHLENRRGRIVLFTAFIFVILTASVYSISAFLNLNAWNSSFDFGIDYLASQPRYASAWIGLSGFFLLLCSTGEYVLLFYSIYIPFQRIRRGALQSVQTGIGAQSMCPRCGRTIPYDAVICPYCGNYL